MAVAVEHLVNIQESVIGLDKAIETIVSTIGRFNGKDTTIYVEAYKPKMLMWDIPEDRCLSRFP